MPIDVDCDDVAIGDKSDRSEFSRLGSNVPEADATRGAAEPPTTPAVSQWTASPRSCT